MYTRIHEGRFVFLFIFTVRILVVITGDTSKLCPKTPSLSIDALCHMVSNPSQVLKNPANELAWIYL